MSADPVGDARYGARVSSAPENQASAPAPEGHASPPGPVSLAELELDLEVFSGPFDLLLTLVLREEVDLLELQLAEVVLAYLDHLEARGELDLETATEFIVLIAALLELKSRLILSGDEAELLDIEPEAAAEELLARMLDARRYRSAAAHLGELLAAEEGVRFRAAPLPASLRRTIIPPAEGSQSPELLGEAMGRLLLMPPTINVRHIAVARVSVAERLAHLRRLLRRGHFSFDEAVRGADRMTVAVTLFALLELYKRGEAEWSQEESFGEIDVRARAREAPAVPTPLALALAAGFRGGAAG
jgi:segregation and condensation protein A